MQGLNWF